MTKPILYKANETNFERLGLGVLSDNVEAFTIEKRNGEFYFEMKYPIGGKLFNELKNERIIKADVSMNLKNQRFEIVRITKPSKGLVTVYADHVHYQSEKSQLKPEVPFSGSAHLALNTWRNNIVGDHEFTTYSDIDFASSGTWSINRHKSARRALLGTAGSMLDIYGGEYRFDNYHIQLLQARGNDTGALIAYGKNLTDLEQEEQIANTYTSVYPYSVILKEDETEELVTLPEHFIDSEHVDNFARRKIMLVDFSDEQIDNIADLRSRAESYIVSNNVGVPSVNLRVKFLDLAKTKDYENLKAIEHINLCDWVTVYFEKFGIRRRAKVIMTKWNCNLDRYEEIELGDARAGLSESISTTVDGRLETVINRLNTVQLAADGKTKIFRGTETPVNANEGDVWFKPIAEGGREMHIFNGAEWQLEEYSAGSLKGTINFANLNAINFIADNISGGRMNLANDLSITNGDELVLYIDPQSGQVVGNFSELQINFKDVATKEDLEEIELQKGDDGKTAYDLAVEEGFEGTLQEWLQSLNGSDGSDGESGTDGVSITSVIPVYAVNTSMTNAPTGTYSATVPNRNSGQYIWRKDVISFSNNTQQQTEPVLMTGDKGDKGQDGTDGQDGTGVVSAVVDYQNHTNGTQAPTGAWSTTIPAAVQGQYLWTRTTTNYSDNSEVVTYSVSYLAKDGEKGADGTDGENGTDGVDGQDGKGIENTQIRYQLHTSGTSTPTGTWLQSLPDPIKGQFLWTRTILTFTDASTSTSYSTSYFATDGQNGTDGQDGSDGISITGITAEFAVNTSPTSAPTSGWSTTRPNRSASQYMWTRDRVQFSNNTEEVIGTRMITGDKGDTGSDGQDGSDGTNGTDGQDGQSVSNITQQFAVNTSGTSAPLGGSFSNTRPQNWQSGQYIWTRFMIVYINPSDTRYTTPIVDTSFEAVEELKEIVKVKDTRNSNYAPSHYRDNYGDYQVQERKINTVIGVPSENTHGILVTTYSDSRVEQIFSSGGETFTRYGNPSTDIWEEWTSVESEEGAQEKANDSFGNATEYALQVSQNAEANAKNHADALVNPLKEDLDTAQENLVELEATVQANNAQWLQSFTASGGVNEIMNSVGYAELEFWNGSGNITTVQNAELETYGSGSAFILGSNSTLEQNVIAESGYRTFSVIVEKDSSSSGYIEIEHDDGVELISLNSGTEMNFVRFVLTFDMAGTNYTIRLNTDSGSEILFTNVMINYGVERQRWGFANGEVYGSTFRMNRNGFRVYQLDGQQYTAMTPTEFAGYAIVGGVWERTFALNGDTTEMNKARIKHELQIGRAAQIWVESDTSNGIATVRSE